LITTDVSPTNAFALNPDFKVDVKALEHVIGRRAGADHVHTLDATATATSLLGDAIGANLFIVGYAWQKGLIPLQRASIEQAIDINGTAKAMNLKAFQLGRLAAANPEVLKRLTGERDESKPVVEQSLDQIVASRMAHLTAYQNDALARRYRALVDRVDGAEKAIGKSGLAAAVAHVYAKLLAYKDEYEVARLFTAPEFRKQLAETFEGDYQLTLNLAPPLLSQRDPATGRLRKRPFGPWILHLFKVLASLKGLRGTPLDIFGYPAHRRLERKLIGEYEALVEKLVRDLTPANHADAVATAKLYDSIRGYDVVKEAAVEKVHTQLKARTQPEAMKQAAE
jgi:indolepyruvate ferredoxin oxidoreductase